jgi:hypothetical protein
MNSENSPRLIMVEDLDKDGKEIILDKSKLDSGVFYDLQIRGRRYEGVSRERVLDYLMSSESSGIPAFYISLSEEFNSVGRI